MKKVILACFLSFAWAVWASDIVHIDPSQTPQYNPNAVATQPPPNAVNSTYKPYCSAATGKIIGMYMPVETYPLYNASGVVTSIVEADGISGVAATHTFTTTLTYSGTNLIGTSCPQ